MKKMTLRWMRRDRVGCVYERCRRIISHSKLRLFLKKNKIKGQIPYTLCGLKTLSLVFIFFIGGTYTMRKYGDSTFVNFSVQN
jgi:hypothetical protein